MTFHGKPTYFVWDVESTGTNVFEDRIVQFFGATADSQGNLLDTWEFFINPGVPVPEEAAAVHGFDDDFLAENGMEPYGALNYIRNLFLSERDLIQVAFNMNYDLSIIDAEMKRHGVSDNFGAWFAENAKLVDGLVIDRHKDKYRKGKRNLETQAKHYGVEFDPESAHSAVYDVQKTAEVTIKILEKFGTPTTKEQAQWYRGWAVNFQEYRRRTDPEVVIDSSWPLRVKEEAWEQLI